MDTRERHIRENEGHHHESDVREDLVANSLKVDGKKRENRSTRNINKLWLWLGVLVLIAILLWWVFTYVIEIDLFGGFNG